MAQLINSDENILAPKKFEVIDGIVCMSPYPSRFHNRIIAELYYIFRDYLRNKSNKKCVVKIIIQPLSLY